MLGIILFISGLTIFGFGGMNGAFLPTETKIVDTNRFVTIDGEQHYIQKEKTVYVEPMDVIYWSVIPMFVGTIVVVAGIVRWVS